MELKTYNATQSEINFAIQTVEEAVEKKKADPTVNCAYSIKAAMNSLDEDGCGWNVFVVDSTGDFSSAIEAFKSIKIERNDYTILIFRMLIKCF